MSRTGRMLVMVLAAAGPFGVGFAFSQFQRQQKEEAQNAARYPDWNAGTQTLAAEELPAARVYTPPTDVAEDHSGMLSAIKDDALRATIARVMPACVAVDSGSGVCISAAGDVLTNAHVALSLGRKMIVRFPDGTQVIMTCRALNRRLDLAVVSANVGAKVFPFVAISADGPRAGQTVVAIGQPAPVSPRGEGTGFKPFHVSVGRILFVGDDLLGDQLLGRVRHDAWTYWGHSGSPLFDDRGRVVALHNSWDATHGRRHAVPQQAIVKFLREAGVRVTLK